MHRVFKHSKKTTFVLLGLIVLFAAFLRFYHISDIPVSLYWDEVASTYNAYSIAQTGRDEFGTPFPLLFRSFEDYKAPGNIYLTALIVPIFGLNEFSARFTSALGGTMTVLLTFFLVKELLFLRQDEPIFLWRKKIPLHASALGLLASSFLAISPWHIQFSRTGFEANVAVAITIGGVWLFLHGVRRHRKWLYYLSMFLFAIDFYFYRSIWIFLPVLLLGLLIFLRKHIFAKNQIRTTSIGIMIFIIVLLPFLPTMFSPQGLVRASQVNVFTNSDQNLLDAAQKRTQSGLDKIIYNQRFIYAEIIIGNYFSHFSPQFLFLTGDPNLRHGPHGMGELYLWEAPFLLFGLYILFHLGRPARNILLLWLLISPLPAAFSTPSPHALRSLNMLPVFQILVALGVYCLFYCIGKLSYRRIYLSVLTLIIIGFFLRYLYLYYVVDPAPASSVWADGYKELTAYMLPRENQYQKLIVTGHYWKPYIYFLFYKQYGSSTFQAEGGNEFHFGKYLFSGTAWGGQKELDNRDLAQFAHAKKILVAMSPGEWETQRKKLHYLTTIKNHNNEIVFIVGDIK